MIVGGRTVIVGGRTVIVGGWTGGGIVTVGGDNGRSVTNCLLRS